MTGPGEQDTADGGLEAELEALDGLEQTLAGLYQVETPPQLAPFVVGEEAVEQMARTGAIAPRQGAREEVFLLDDGQELSVAVFLDRRARHAARQAVQQQAVTLNAEVFADFCVALEGVSHFLLVTHRANAGQPVTQLELELQAEVDKYVMARLCPWQSPSSTEGGHIGSSSSGPEPNELLRTLFQRFTLADHLRDEQAERYITATRLALRYCRRLEREFLSRRRRQELTADLRAFFRKSQAARLDHIGGG